MLYFPTRPALIFQGVGVSLALAQRVECFLATDEMQTFLDLRKPWLFIIESRVVVDSPNVRRRKNAYK